MSWITITLLSASFIGLISVLDKAFLHHFARSYLTLALLIALGQATIGVVFIAIAPMDDLSMGPVGWSIGAGALWAVATIIIVKVMTRREVSRVIPVVQTFPIFVAPIAVLFLGERLESYHWATIFMTVAGAVMISMRQNDGGTSFVLDGSFYLLLFASFSLAAMNVASKQSVENLPVLTAHGIRAMSFGVTLLALSIRTESLDEIREMVRRKSPALGLFAGNEFLVANTGMLLGLWALSLGPVSLVTALTAASSLFLLLYTTLLALRFKGMLGEQVTRRTVAVKLTATTLIVIGVATISLG